MKVLKLRSTQHATVIVYNFCYCTLIFAHDILSIQVIVKNQCFILLLKLKKIILFVYINFTKPITIGEDLGSKPHVFHNFFLSVIKCRIDTCTL